MKQIPSILVLAALLIIGAAWPSVQAWSDASILHHYLVHCLYLLAGGLSGLQSARWVVQTAGVGQVDEEAGVSS